MRLCIPLWIGLLFALTLPAQAALCPQCKDSSYTKDIGACTACKDGRTASGQFKLCGRCSAKLAQCEHCQKALPAAATQATTRPLATDKDGTYAEGAWEFRLRVNNEGTRSQGYTGELLYQGQPVAEPATRNDFYQTPWGPMYWVGNPPVAFGTHGWMPKPRASVPAGKQLTEPKGNARTDLTLWVRMVSPDGQATKGLAPLEPWVQEELKKLNVTQAAPRSDWMPLHENFVVLHDSRHYGQLQVRLAASRNTELLLADFGSPDSQVELPRKLGSTRLVHTPLQSSVAKLDLYLAFKVAPAPAGKQIPLTSCHATSAQEGLQQVYDGPFPGKVSPLAMAFGWAKDFKGLTRQSLVPATKGQELKLSHTPESLLWVAIHLGTSGGSPPQFLLDSVTFTSEGQIDLAYHPTHAVPMTKDVHDYRVWIPLGNLKPGPYTVRVINAGKPEAEQKFTVTAAPAGK